MRNLKPEPYQKSKGASENFSQKLPRTLLPAPLQPTPANFGLIEQYWNPNTVPPS